MRAFRKYRQCIGSFLADSLLCLRARVSSAPVLTILKDTIRRQGAITIERYMEIALQHPKYGYYRHGNPVGTGGDFHTAPEISPLFGEMVGVWCMNAWERLGKPERITLLELGPGRGSLLSDLLRFTETSEDFQKALRIYLFESNATLRALQRNRLEKFSPVHIDSFAQLEAEPLLFIANELFDNIPARMFINTASGWAERLIDLKDDNLIFVDKKIADVSLQAFINNNMKNAKPGDVYETSGQSYKIMEQLSAHIVRYGGMGLVIDYGHAEPSGQTTLAAWSRHAYTNLLASPGNTDVTVGVDFSALRRAAEGQGAFVDEVVGQGEFLLGLGIRLRAQDMGLQAPPKTKQKINAAVHKLTSPSEMGSLWKALVVSGCLSTDKK